MSKVFYRKQFSNYLGEQRAIDDIIARYIPDGGVSPTPTPVPVTPTPTPSITPTRTLTPTPTPTSSGVPITPTPTPTVTTTSSPTPTPSITPTRTLTPTPTLTRTPTLTPTNTGSPTPTPTVTPSSTPPDVYCAIKAEGNGYILTENGNEILRDNCISPLSPIYVVGGAGTFENEMAYSTDTTSWKGVGNVNTIFGGTGAAVYALRTNGSIWVAGGQSGSSPTFSSRVATSTDGINWTGVTSMDGYIGSNIPREIGWNGTYFLLGGVSGATTDAVYLSADGNVWAQSVNLKTMMQVPFGFSYGNGRDVTVGQFGTGVPQICISLDNGLNWIPGVNVSSIFTSRVDGVAFSPTLNRFVAVGAANTIGYSTDGLTWSASTGGTLFTGGTLIRTIAYSNTLDRFVAGGTAGVVAVSNDGITWTQSPNSQVVFTGTNINLAINKITWSDTQFVGVGYGTTDGVVGTSPDGLTWTPSPISGIVAPNTVFSKPSLGVYPQINL